MAANSCTDHNVAVIMVPFPEYGHQIPLLRLSRLISSHNIPVHYVNIGVQTHQLKVRLQDWNLDHFSNLHFHDLMMSNIPSSEQDPVAYFSSLRLFEEPLTAICRQLLSTCNRVVVIHDFIMLSVVQAMYETPNVETYFFHAISAFTVCSLFQQVSDSGIHDDLLLPYQPHIPSIESCYYQGMREFVKTMRDCTFKSGDIFNTYIDIEGPYLDALAKQSEKPLWGLGPFNPVDHIVHDNDNNNDDSASLTSKVTSHTCIEWLDKQPQNSVIYVSFGTAITFSPEQINELAAGLERCEQKFIWVLRSKDKKGNVDIPKIELPTGFEERVAERGIIARDWVPQLEILAHPSTGGYLFHSGWNSFLESVTMGVPMATWPMHSDNPINDVLITKVLKVGVVVRDWTHKDELVTSNTIANAVTTLMNSPQGEEMRHRARELSKAIKISVRDGGTTQKQTKSFISHITR